MIVETMNNNGCTCHISERKVSLSLLQYSKAMDMRTAGEVNSIVDLMVTQM